MCNSELIQGETPGRPVSLQMFKTLCTFKISTQCVRVGSSAFVFFLTLSVGHVYWLIGSGQRETAAAAGAALFHRSDL